MAVSRRIPLLLPFLSALLVAASARRSLHVGLHASWNETHPSAEAFCHLSRTFSTRVVLPSAVRLCNAARDATEGSDLFNISPQLELSLTERAVAPLFHDQAIATRTLEWLLGARLYSPAVAVHHAAAYATLSRFGVASSPNDVPSVFVVDAPVSRRSATLITDLDRVVDCKACHTVFEADHAPLSFLQPIEPEIVLSPHPHAPRVRFVYADVMSGAFCEWLPTLQTLVGQHTHRTVLRFWTTRTAAYKPALQAFAVHATLKSTEYKVVDDRLFDTKLFAECGYAGTPCAPAPSEEPFVAWDDNAESPSLTGLKALQYISHGTVGDTSAMLRKLRLFTEEMPSVTRSALFQDAEFVNASLEMKLYRKVSRMRGVIGDGQYLFINGHSLTPRSLLHASEKLFRCMSSISAAAANAPKLFKDGTESEIIFRDLHAKQHDPDGSLRVDLHLDKLAPNALVQLNDMHSDSRYKKWKSLDVTSTDDIKHFVDTVALKQIRISLSHRKHHTDLVKVKGGHLSLVLVVDPGDTQQFGYMSVPQSVIQADLPIQVSMLLVPNGRTSSLVAAGFHYLLRLKGRKTAVKFLKVIMEILEYIGAFQPVSLSPEMVDMSFSRIAADMDTEYSSVADILDHDQDVKSILEESLRFAETMKLFSDIDESEVAEEDASMMSDEEAPKRKLSMLCVLNGIVVKDVSADVVPLALSEQQRIAKLFENDHSTNTMLKAERLFDRWVSVDPSLIVVRRVGRGLKTKERQTRVTTSDDVLPPMTAGSLNALQVPLTDVRYIPLPSAEDYKYTTTVWLASIDHSLPEFIRAKKILEELAVSDIMRKLNARIAILDPATAISHEVLGCSIASSCLDIPVIVINGKRLPTSLFLEVDDLVIQLASHFDSAEISDIEDDDMRLLHLLHVNEISAACEMSGGHTDERIPLSTITTAIKENSHEALSFLDALKEERKHPTPLSVLAVVNPLNPEAYIVASFLEELRHVYDSDILSMDVVLAPSSNALKKEQDITNTYRKFVLQGRPAFQDESKNRSPPRALFYGLPQKSVLTVAVEPPRAWFVSSHSTNYDMDNVILETLPENATELHAEYELTNLIVEGSCIDETESPPQGLKLYLENDNGVSVDTLVMANLGYFQLKVPTPGRWNLRLASGRSSKIFSLLRMEMYKGFTKTTYTAGADGRVLIPVESFDGAGGIILRVKRNEGMEGMSLLNGQGDTKGDGSVAKASILSQLKSSLSSIYSNRAKSHLEPPAQTAEGDKKYDTIHVFSVASGHLYERFLKIMITSVTKHASRPVKFWLLENYLSPSFKKVLPLFAARHGAEVGMVTYGWPGWLRAQTEKQRIIWAYKILFLDVLFPLDVGRIIFVDSDQVIRGDLAELMDIDLKGAPYGYVPFCDSRKEVEGYRFWKTGFWKETLQGAKYRISALYVVDLNTFRETAAGDSLRSIYQGLSADPNSLSNLDQDLPNYASTMSSMGGTVPIFDLPQEWLWCESWCDDESKAKAKAIDLCNNPMTKEPKLSSAKRIISEWVDYDNAASDLTEELYRYLQSQVIPNLTPENVTCKASSPQTHHEKATLPLADIQLKEEL
eukprot:TRINITY_DN447_c0_g1_i1.p1 TRINITY_DN447_c0_g1~~TRINITY_DN447_c0_g1_i1.p1  ORF type:complete len:1580 (-),score=271.61 TRINITY_DN447_c0_g1_i1:7291-12030(-)